MCAFVDRVFSADTTIEKQLDERVKLEGSSLSFLAYADDIIVLLGNDDTHTMKSECVRLIGVAKQVGL